jgi:hypothetical protein
MRRLHPSSYVDLQKDNGKAWAKLFADLRKLSEGGDLASGSSEGARSLALTASQARRSAVHLLSRVSPSSQWTECTVAGGNQVTWLVLRPRVREFRAFQVAVIFGEDRSSVVGVRLFKIEKNSARFKSRR